MTGSAVRTGERGSILLLVMWVAAGLAMVALSIAVSVRTELAATRYRLESEQARFLAQGGIEQSLFILRNQGITDEEGRPLYKPGQTRIDFRFSSGQVRVDIVPETGKLSINNITRGQLRELLLACGLVEEKASELADQILAWRQALGHTVERPEDLLAVPGVTPELFYGWFERNQQGELVSHGGLVRMLSPFGTPGPVDLNYAPAEVLLTVPGMEPEIVRALVDGRRKGIYEQLEDLPVQIPVAAAPFVALHTISQVFTLVSTGYPAAAEAHSTVRALVRRDPLTGQIKLLHWDEVGGGALEITDTGS